jgi:hypothetical protein
MVKPKDKKFRDKNIMRPIYFPFTYLPQPIFERLNTLFPQILVCQPSGNRIPESLMVLRETKRVDILLPDESKDPALDRLLEEYRHWAQNHRGEPSDVFKLSPPKVPFFDDTSSSQIRMDVKKSIANEINLKKEGGKPDALLTALAFLTMAQEFDQQQYELLKEIDHLDLMEKNLFDTLKGDAIGAIGDPCVEKIHRNVEMVANHMPKERINAWIQLFFHQLQMMTPENAPVKDSLLFVTSSKSVMDCIIEKAPDIDISFSVEGIPLKRNESPSDIVFFNNLRDGLISLATTSQPGSGERMTHPGAAAASEKGTTLSIYRILDKSPVAFLAYLAGVDGPEKESVSALPWRHTLIGILSDQTNGS